MSRVSPAAILEALQLEGSVNVLPKQKGERFLRVAFRIGGDQVQLSTGAEKRREAKKRAAQIFADAIRAPRDAAVEARLARIEDLLAGLLNQLGSDGAITPVTAFAPTSQAILTGAVSEFCEIKSKTVSLANYERLAGRVRAFGNFFAFKKRTQNINGIKKADLHAWLRIKDGEEVSRGTKNKLDAVAQFYRWAINSGYAAENPAAQVSIKQTTVGRAFPDLNAPATMAEFMRYLEEKHPNWIIFYAVAGFSGVRADKPRKIGGEGGEIVRLLTAVKREGWERYFPACRSLRIPKGKVKGLPRPVFTPDNLKEWIRCYPKSLDAPTQKQHQALASKFGFKPNSMRDTAISTYVALTGNLAHAALLFGNSPEIIQTRYLNIISEEDVKKYLAIVPSKIAPGALNSFVSQTQISSGDSYIPDLFGAA